MYHATNKKFVQQIMKEGLKVGKSGGHTYDGGQWAFSVYGKRPIYLSAKPNKYPGAIIKVDVTDLPLIADLQSIYDTGAYYCTNHDGEMWWKNTPDIMSDVIDQDGYIYFDDLLDPEHHVASAAIQLTSTAAVLEDIQPCRLTLM